MFIPSFRFNLNLSIPHSGLVCIGKFDGINPSLVAVTNEETISIHTPNRQQEVRVLNLNRKITAVAVATPQQNQSAANTDSASPLGDYLLVGSPSSLLCYNVESNSDVFYREVPDGVSALTFHTNSAAQPTILVGGNCSLQGFTLDGAESFWTVTGDLVTSIVARMNSANFLVGSEDCQIRLFDGETIKNEFTEAEIVKSLCFLTDSPQPNGAASRIAFGFALANGTCGVYGSNNTKLWSSQSKHSITALTAFDLDGDGVTELIIGYSSGKLEARNALTGELIYKDKFGSSLVHLTVADYRGDGTQQLIAVSSEGEVRGYNTAEATAAAAVGLMEESKTDLALQALNRKKNELLAELKNYENQLKSTAPGSILNPTKEPRGSLNDGKSATGAQSGSSGSAPASLNGATIIPVQTRLIISFKPSKSHSSLLLNISTNNETLIKLILVQNDLIFPQSTLCVYPKQPQTSISIPIRFDKPIQTDLLVRCVVGYRGSQCDHVFEFPQALPKFANFQFVMPREIPTNGPRGSVTFQTSERVNRVLLWINSSFPVDNSVSGFALSPSGDSLSACFVSIRDGKPLFIKMTPDHGGQVQIRTDSIDLAGEMIQSLGSYLKLKELEVVAEFPDELGEFEEILNRVEELNDVRMRLSADIAEASNELKMKIIRAEDARILRRYGAMARYYNEILALNRELLGEYNKRANNHQELLNALKQVNAMIQKAAKLRLGDAKNRIINACRAAVKANNPRQLINIIKSGHVEA